VTLELTQADIARMGAAVQARYPEEGCGILLGMWGGHVVRASELVPADNIAATHRRTSSYQLDWHALLRALARMRDTGLELIGFFHSHPDGTGAPSAVDLRGASRHLIQVIVPVSRGRAGAPRAWRFHAGRAEPVSICVPDRAYQRA